MSFRVWSNPAKVASSVVDSPGCEGDSGASGGRVDQEEGLVLSLRVWKTLQRDQRYASSTTVWVQHFELCMGAAP